MKTIDQHIEEVMDEFNFYKVHEVMEFMDWTWATTKGIPEISDLRKEVRRVMNSMYSEYSYRKSCSATHSTGGFSVTYHKGIDEMGVWDRFCVTFNVSEWST